jgi:hypothetical protein
VSGSSVCSASTAFGEEIVVTKLLAGAVVLIVFCTGWSAGQSQQGPDGNAWDVIPPAARTFYVKGFSDGYAAGVLHAGVLAGAKNAPETVSAMNTAERKDYEELLAWARRIVPFEVGGPPKSVGELEGVLDTFYRDYRNAPVCMNKAIMFAIASMAGNAAPEQELAAARKSGAEVGCNDRRP